MDEQRFERLTVLMGCLARGERGAVFALHREFGAEVASAVRRHLRSLGVRSATREDVDDLVFDVCDLLARKAPGWSPEHRTAPWTWAARAIRRTVSDAVGQFADRLPDDFAPVEADAGPVAGGDEDDLAVLRRLGARRADVGALVAALEGVATARDQAIWVTYELQASLGDPSPACTVGREFGMKPPAVRQVVSRVRARLEPVRSGAELGAVALSAAS